MPFKKGKAPADAAKNVNDKLESITSKSLERALTIVAFQIGGNADFYVPVDTNNLMNSRAIRVIPNKDGFRAILSYGGPKVSYPLFLHGTATYSPLWKPKLPGTPGKKTGGYNSSALPGWIFRGVADTDINGIFAKAMKI
jgi:hypothetical protein